MAPTQPILDLAALSPVLETWQPRQIVEWAVKHFGDELLMSSSFGAESAVLIHLAHALKPDIRIVIVDTGFLFAETHAFLELLRERFDLNVKTYRPRNDPTAYLKQASELDPTVRKNVEGCCAVNKNEPFERAMRELKPTAWLRGIRRSQSDTRRNRQIIERSDRFNCLAISPLLNWTSHEIHAYLKQHNLPYHPLADQGYLSIGCSPLTCTRPIQIGEDPRSGRWMGTEKTECGLNL